MSLREAAPKPTPEQYEKNFADITPPMNARQAAIEAFRCLYCFDAPCTIACPTRIDVPGFIKRIMTGNVRGAARFRGQCRCRWRIFPWIQQAVK